MQRARPRRTAKNRRTSRPAAAKPTRRRKLQHHRPAQTVHAGRLCAHGSSREKVRQHAADRLNNTTARRRAATCRLQTAQGTAAAARLLHAAYHLQVASPAPTDCKARAKPAPARLSYDRAATTDRPRRQRARRVLDEPLQPSRPPTATQPPEKQPCRPPPATRRTPKAAMS